MSNDCMFACVMCWHPMNQINILPIKIITGHGIQHKQTLSVNYSHDEITQKFHRTQDSKCNPSDIYLYKYHYITCQCIVTFDRYIIKKTVNINQPS